MIAALWIVGALATLVWSLAGYMYFDFSRPGESHLLHWFLALAFILSLLWLALLVVHLFP